MKQIYERKSIYTIDEVYEVIKEHLNSTGRPIKIMLDGDLIKANSQRYQVFFNQGMKCVECGIEGKYFAKERPKKTEAYHLNLYGIDKDGNEVLMTKDHIIPKSKGGPNELDNYQCMCQTCNKAKGNILKMEVV